MKVLNIVLYRYLGHPVKLLLHPQRLEDRSFMVSLLVPKQELVNAKKNSLRALNVCQQQESLP